MRRIVQLLVFIFIFKAKGPCDAPLAHLPPHRVLPYMTINVTSLKGCSPIPNPAGSAKLAFPSILSPEIFPFHPLLLILVLGIRWWGARGVRRWVLQRELAECESCSPFATFGDGGKHLSVCQEPRCLAR